MFIDTGIRLGEMAGLTVADVDLDAHDVIHVTGKGARERAAPFEAKTGQALSRYLRERIKHPDAKRSPNLWLGGRGAMTASASLRCCGAGAGRPGSSICGRIGSATRSRTSGRRPTAATMT